MAIEDEKTTDALDAPEEGAGSGPTSASSQSLQTGRAAITPEGSSGPGAADDDEVYEAEAPNQLGYERFVYAAYFAAGIGVAFVSAKAISVGWARLSQWKPILGEPRDEFIMPIAALAGIGFALYYWRNVRTRELVQDVASELAKVTWPSRTEVANNTVIVIFTTTFATVFFTLMDRFWGFVTNWVYGT